jgi:hypothetical protein
MSLVEYKRSKLDYINLYNIRDNLVDICEHKYSIGNRLILLPNQKEFDIMISFVKVLELESRPRGDKKMCVYTVGFIRENKTGSVGDVISGVPESSLMFVKDYINKYKDASVSPRDLCLKPFENYLVFWHNDIIKKKSDKRQGRIKSFLGFRAGLDELIYRVLFDDGIEEDLIEQEIEIISRKTRIPSSIAVGINWGDKPITQDIINMADVKAGIIKQPLFYIGQHIVHDTIGKGNYTEYGIITNIIKSDPHNYIITFKSDDGREISTSMSRIKSAIGASVKRPPMSVSSQLQIHDRVKYRQHESMPEIFGNITEINTKGQHDIITMMDDSKNIHTGALWHFTKI